MIPVVPINRNPGWGFVQAYKRALTDGVLVPAKHCECCGCEAPPNQKHAGHHRDYSKPLVVVWLCVNCHAQEHGLIVMMESYPRSPLLDWMLRNRVRTPVLAERVGVSPQHVSAALHRKPIALAFAAAILAVTGHASEAA